MPYLQQGLDKVFNIGQRFIESIFPQNIDYKKWFALLGASYVSWKGLKCLNFFYTNFIRPRRDLLTRYGESSWVVVVGASGGLGRAFCEAFADAGFNIILVGRNRAKLELTAGFIRQRNSKTGTRIVLADLREAVKGPEFAEEIMRQVEDLEISVLVNSVAVPDNDYFHNRTDQSLVEELTVNYFAPTFLSKKFVNRFLKRAKRSAVINISAGAGVRPTPYTVPYSPSKTFLDSLTRCFELEVRNKIDVVSVVPDVLHTNLMFNQDYTSDAILPEKCAVAVLNSLGYEIRTEGYWKHKIIASVMDSIPEGILAKVYRRAGPHYIEWRKVQTQRTASGI